MTQLTPESIGGIAAIVGAVIGGAIMALKKCGLITIGKPTERRGCQETVKGICQDHGSMRADIETIKHNSAARSVKLDQMDNKLDSVSESVSRIEGYLAGRNGYGAK